MAAAHTWTDSRILSVAAELFAVPADSLPDAAEPGPERPQVSDLLVASGLLTPEQLDAVLARVYADVQVLADALIPPRPPAARRPLPDANGDPLTALAARLERLLDALGIPDDGAPAPATTNGAATPEAAAISEPPAPGEAEPTLPPTRKPSTVGDATGVDLLGPTLQALPPRPVANTSDPAATLPMQEAPPKPASGPPAPPRTKSPSGSWVALPAAGAKRARPARGALSGRLKQTSLPAVLHLLGLSRSTGQLVITAGEGEGAVAGTLGCEDGEVVHAHCGELSGEPAFQYLAALPDGDFLFVPGNAPEERTITRTTQMVLLDALRAMEAAEPHLPGSGETGAWDAETLADAPDEPAPVDLPASVLTMEDAQRLCEKLVGFAPDAVTLRAIGDLVNACPDAKARRLIREHVRRLVDAEL